MINKDKLIKSIMKQLKRRCVDVTVNTAKHHSWTVKSGLCTYLIHRNVAYNNQVVCKPYSIIYFNKGTILANSTVLDMIDEPTFIRIEEFNSQKFE